MGRVVNPESDRRVKKTGSYSKTTIQYRARIQREKDYVRELTRLIRLMPVPGD